ncbi:MAG: hypothetical protein QW688_02145 [Thermoprotei archaeon]
MEAFEFYLWVFEKNRSQPNWSNFQVINKLGNKLNFRAEYRLLGKPTIFEGVAILNPERVVEFSITNISQPMFKADPALIRYVLRPVRQGTLVTKTWHFMFQSKLHPLYEWLVALQIKRNLSQSFKADIRNLEQWGVDATEKRALPISA